ncbi:MAG: tryptophan-rich sensory protein [Haliscomenobacter sp.]|nr:tryptophan-rich sensory protein [Haliscomenobacter sp.]
MANNHTFNFWIALAVFVTHIIANLIVTKPNPELFTRLEKLTLFPPGWVFLIWFVIWTLQSISFYRTYGSAFWDNSITLLFVLVCIGNIGSQYAGATQSWLADLHFLDHLYAGQCDRIYGENDYVLFLISNCKTSRSTLCWLGFIGVFGRYRCHFSYGPKVSE